jgi:nucleoside-diphosphate-sugar epimerase
MRAEAKRPFGRNAAGSKQQSPPATLIRRGSLDTFSLRQKGVGYPPIWSLAIKVFFFGLGYCARRLIQREPWIEASGTARSAEGVAALRREGVEAYNFDGAEAEPALEQALEKAEAIVVSIPPREGAGATLDRFGPTIAAAPALRRIVYYSTIGVYGDYGGAWVDETSAMRTGTARGLARIEDEARWAAAAETRGAAADILRLAGIYGPGRNALVNVRRGEARRIIKPEQVFNRAHVDDIAEISRLVLTRNLKGQIWNVADEEPAPPQDVIAYAAALLGVEPPPEEPFDRATLSPMAREFYADNKRVAIAKAKAELGFAPTYPSYREGLKALAETGEGKT